MGTKLVDSVLLVLFTTMHILIMLVTLVVFDWLV